MNVSSVKNLNGETFSAVQDAALTDVVQTNSGVWNDVSAYQTNSGDYLKESELGYNAVDEVSAINGSAIAQYGAEKQWLVHDDTLVHASNSAQYALGVNLSAVAQLLGIDETVLWSGTEGVTTAFNLSGIASNYNKVRYEWKWNNGVDAQTMNTVLIPDSTFFTLFSIGTTTGNNNKYYTVGRFVYNADFTNLTYQSGWQGNNAVPTTATTMERFIRIQKIVGIGRKS